MIKVQEKNEPANFHNNVRRDGERFLRNNAHRVLSSSDFPKLWKNCLSDLRTAYDGICAYTASYIEIDSGHSIGTVDHYIPKTIDRNLAYEWSNYRFCNPRVNEHKDNSLDVIDPFHIQNGWFVIDFSTFRINPADGLIDLLETSVQNTIDQLQLNDDDRLIQARTNRIIEYANDEISFAYLERKYPFIAFELDRQGMIDTIKPIYRRTP